MKGGMGDLEWLPHPLQPEFIRRLIVQTISSEFSSLNHLAGRSSFCTQASILLFSLLFLLSLSLSISSICGLGMYANINWPALTFIFQRHPGLHPTLHTLQSSSHWHAVMYIQSRSHHKDSNLLEIEFWIPISVHNKSSKQKLATFSAQPLEACQISNYSVPSRFRVSTPNNRSIYSLKTFEKPKSVERFECKFCPEKGNHSKSHRYTSPLPVMRP